jgi:hypothetical protein
MWRVAIDARPRSGLDLDNHVWQPPVRRTDSGRASIVAKAREAFDLALVWQGAVDYDGFDHCEGT